MYWTTDGRRCVFSELQDGVTTCVAPVVRRAIGGGIALDSRDAYWSQQEPANIMKVSKAGGPPTVVFPRTLAEQLVVDDANVYWTTGDGTAIRVGPKTGGVSTVLARTADVPGPLCADASNLYVGSMSRIMKVPKAGGTPVALADAQLGAQGVGAEGVHAIAVDETNVYWTAGDWTVNRVGIDGSGRTVLASDQDDAWGIAVDARAVYWTTSGDGLTASNGTVMMLAK